MATDRWGIDDSYHDAQGKQHLILAATRAAIRAAMGAPAIPHAEAETEAETAADGPTGALELRVLAPGDSRRIDGHGELTLEDGTRLSVAGELPPELPFGYHQAAPAGGRRRRGADAAHRLAGALSPAGRPARLGVAAQIYAARSRESWGSAIWPTCAGSGAGSKETLGAGVMMV